MNAAQEYYHLQSPEGAIEAKSYPGPLIVPEINDPVWGIIRKKLGEYQEKEEFEVFFNENPRVLITKAVGLINNIIEHSQKNEPIATLIFLDKSARLAAHLFTTLWLTLRESGKLPPSLKKPAIKYLNLGRHEDHKYQSDRALNLAKKIFSKKDLPEEGVLVIDDNIISGRTMRSALEFLVDTYGSKAEGIALYDYEPGWYRRSQIKGIKEANIPPKLFFTFQRMSRPIFTMVETVMAKAAVDEDFADNFFHNVLELNFLEFASKYSEEFGFRILASIILQKRIQLLLKHWDRTTISNYFKSAGSFLGLREKDQNKRSASLQYRKMLIKMAELAEPHISLLKKDNAS